MNQAPNSHRCCAPAPHSLICRSYNSRASWLSFMWGKPYLILCLIFTTLMGNACTKSDPKRTHRVETTLGDEANMLQAVEAARQAQKISMNAEDKGLTSHGYKLSAKPLSKFEVKDAEEVITRPAVTLEDGIKYTGEWKGHKKHGKGVQTYPDGSTFEGVFVEGVACGPAAFTHVDGSSFQGEFKDDMANGKGLLSHVDGYKYDGLWKDDLKHGKAEESWTDGSKFVGEYKQNKKAGRGTFQWADGSSYDGEFQDSDIHG